MYNVHIYVNCNVAKDSHSYGSYLIVGVQRDFLAVSPVGDGSQRACLALGER